MKYIFLLALLTISMLHSVNWTCPTGKCRELCITYYPGPHQRKTVMNAMIDVAPEISQLCRWVNGINLSEKTLYATLPINLTGIGWGSNLGSGKSTIYRTVFNYDYSHSLVGTNNENKRWYEIL